MFECPLADRLTSISIVQAMGSVHSGEVFAKSLTNASGRQRKDSASCTVTMKDESVRSGLSDGATVHCGEGWPLPRRRKIKCTTD